jgi:hypothetical protein
MCGGVLDCHCDTTRSRRSDFGKIRVKCQFEGRLLVGSSVGLSSRSKFDICRSTNRKNRCCELPQPLILAISAQTTRKVAFWNAFRSEIGCCASNV